MKITLEWTPDVETAIQDLEILTDFDRAKIFQRALVLFDIATHAWKRGDYVIILDKETGDARQIDGERLLS